MIDVCPRCDGANVQMRNGHTTQPKRTDGNRYYCHDCKQSFEEPNQREREGHDGWSAEAVLNQFKDD